jgi:hypothetical protein
MMARVMVAALGAVLLCAQAGAAQEVDDATRASARQLGYSGVEAYEAQNYAAASDKLERAYRVLQVPTLGLWSARALVKLGKLVEAQERYLKVGRLAVSGGDADVQRKAQADAARELAGLEPRLSSLQIELTDANADDVALSIDDSPIASALIGEPRPMNPGAHTLVARRGVEEKRVNVTLAEGEKQRVTLSFSGASTTTGSAAPPHASAPHVTSDAPSAAPADRSTGSTQRLLGWVSVAAGGAGLAFGGITGGLALSKKSGFESNPHCNDSACGPSQQSDVDSYNSMRTMSTVGFIAGGTLAAAGVVLLLTAPSSEPKSSAALWLGPGSVRLRGTF